VPPPVGRERIATTKHQAGGGWVQPGSHNVAAEIVARALLESGATNLQAKLGAEIAARGDHCWISDTRMREALVKPSGGQYHRESIGRARRLMARAGWIESKRIFPQQKPDGAKHPSTHGTTSKRILWKTLGLRSPMTRGERRKRRIEEEKATRRRPSAETEHVPRPRVPLVPELLAMVGGIGAAPGPVARATRRRDERPTDRARRDDDDKRNEARRQIAELEQWEREQTKPRGPP
jgi:hypothetical protein